ncbi:hypothetical protein OG949_40450 (plasmid) [Streptomyces scopuliridis]|uniref:hypothetical protein n=1 Tax=Streptomyces scopuliridis TaxID=452529 RepID=UPI002DDA2C23|nr:hypothetical protein [Streptomyces scopuliridis]WSB39029.1 hypothetical protein OG949_40450 [Streptomyces scopuliridis]
MTSSAADEIPGFNNTRIVAAGRRWDAVRVPRFIGLQALNRIQGQEGAVIMDRDRAMYFLVPPRTTTGWSIQQSAALGETNYVVLPANEKTTPPGPYWLIPPTRGRLHTETAALHAALQTVLGPAAPDQPDLEHLTLDQIRGWTCALCGRRLVRDRLLGEFRTYRGLMSDPTELWACAPEC